MSRGLTTIKGQIAGTETHLIINFTFLHLIFTSARFITPKFFPSSILFPRLHFDFNLAKIRL